MSFVIKTVGEHQGRRQGVVMCVNAHIHTVHTRMYWTFWVNFSNQIEIKFRLENIYSKTHAFEHTIVFGLKKGIGYVPVECNRDVFQLTKKFVYLCSICGGDRRRVVVFMLPRHSVHIVNLDNFLHLVQDYNIRIDETFKKTIDVTHPAMWL